MKNKFKGFCATCRKEIEAGAGECNLVNGKWRVTCSTPCVAPVVAPKPILQKEIGDLSGVMALFDKAKSHLKFPKIELDVPAANIAIRISVAGAQSKQPGALKVVDSNKKSNMGYAWFYGAVNVAGIWESKAKEGEAIGSRLVEFAANPAKVAAEYGKLHGRCCFCRLPLSDERSTAMGYGATCAKNYGLPWGDKPQEFAGAA